MKHILTCHTCWIYSISCVPYIHTIQAGNKTALHLAVEQQDDVNLHIVDFIIQNTTNADQQMTDGNTALHLAAKYDKVECIKLLLRGSANIEICEIYCTCLTLFIALNQSYF